MGRLTWGLLLCLVAGEAWAADIHLKNGSQVTGRIRAATSTAVLVENIIYRGESGSTVTTDGSVAVPTSLIDMIVLDDDDRFEPKGTESFEILTRGEEEMDRPPPPPPTPDIEIEMPEIPSELPEGGDTDEEAAWHPEAIGDEIQVEALGIAIRIPKGFTHEVVEKGGRSILRVLSPAEDEFGVGFNLWVQERRNYAPFDRPESFFRFSQEITQKVLRRKEAQVKETRSRPIFAYSKSVGNAPREAKSTIFRLGMGETAREIEVRVLFTFRSYYVFTFSWAPKIRQNLRPVYEECFTSLRDLD